MTGRTSLALALLATPCAAQDGAGAGFGAPARPVGTLSEVASSIRACWRAPAGLTRLERMDVTVRFSLRRDGSAFPGSRVTFATLPADGEARRRLAQSALDAVRDCTPVRLSETLAASIAGRPLVLRFTHQAPKGQGA